MLCGLLLNALVTQANAGTMPVVGVPANVRPAGPVWHVATSSTRLSFLADQAWLGLFSIGDLVLLSGGLLVIAICVRRTLKASEQTEFQAAAMDVARNSRFAQRSLSSVARVDIAIGRNSQLSATIPSVLSRYCNHFLLSMWGWIISC